VVYHSFSEISPDQINAVVAGKFFQTHKSCLKKLINISRKEPHSLLVIDISPKERGHLNRIFLSAEERSGLFSQLDIGHLIHVDELYVSKYVQGKFQSVIPGLKKDVRFYTLNSIAGEKGNKSTAGIKVTNLSDGKETDWYQKLGYLYPLSGKVVKGNMIGRTIGFPTANLQIDDKSKILPPMGVYSGLVRIASGWHKAMINIGIRPTLDLDNFTIEANIFDFEGDLYGQNMSLHFYRRIREELRFPSLSYLRGQLMDDKRRALELLAKLNKKPEMNEFLIICD
jgi:FAD synthase